MLINFFKKFFYYVLVTYLFLSFFIFAPYYNYQYARTHGFIDWIFFGEIIPTLKAPLFPYFLYKDINNSDQVKSEVYKILSSLNYFREATNSIQSSDLEQGKEKMKKAYEIINNVNFEIAKEADVKIVFFSEKYYKPAISKYIQYIRTGNNELRYAADDLMLQFNKSIRNVNQSERDKLKNFLN